MSKPLLLFAHGAGAPSSSPWMQRYRALFGSFAKVVSFDYPYMIAGKKTPDRLPQLIEAHRSALRSARQGHSGQVVLVGKSMGGRVGCHLALQEPVDGVVCLGYPLQGMGKSGQLRDAVLLELNVPALFVQGTRDNLCPLPLLETTRSRMQAPSELFVVDGGDHSLRVTRTKQKELALTQEDIEQQVSDRVRAFVAGLN